MSDERAISSEVVGCTADDTVGAIDWASGADWASAADVPFTRVALHLGLPTIPAALDEWRGLMEEARRGCVEHAAVMVRSRGCAIERITADRVELTGGECLHSRLLACGFRHAGAFGLVAAALCAGHGLDPEIRRLWDAGRPDAAMALDAYGSALIEELRSRLFSTLGRICGERGEHVLPYLSPGYDGWPLEDQGNLFAVLGDAAGPIELLDSGGLRPSKSSLVVFGLTRIGRAGAAGHRLWDLTRATMKGPQGREWNCTGRRSRPAALEVNCSSAAPRHRDSVPGIARAARSSGRKATRTGSRPE